MDGVKEGYEYIPAGQVSKITDGNGNFVQYYYNSPDRIACTVCKSPMHMTELETGSRKPIPGEDPAISTMRKNSLS